MSKYSYTVFIDESGDEGFVFNADGSGSTRWLILSAVVVRRKNGPKVVQLMRQVRAVLGRSPNQPLHFVRLDHAARVAYARAIGEADGFMRTVSVLIHKPSLREPEKFQAEKHLLYRYASRFLLERVSWLCEEHHIEGEGSGLAEIIFSNRDQMSYDDLRDYLRHLKAGGADALSLNFSWRCLDPDHVRAVQHAQLAGLQVADAVASGLFAALNPNRFGDTETRYAQLLQPTFRRHKGVVLGFGLKFWPGELASLKAQNPRLAGFADLIGE
jgi:hypothetical protein